MHINGKSTATLLKLSNLVVLSCFDFWLKKRKSFKDSDTFTEDFIMNGNFVINENKNKEKCFISGIKFYNKQHYEKLEHIW